VTRRQIRNSSAIQWLAALVPALAALPAAYFVARSTWYWLILGWHVQFWPALGVAVAVVAGLVVEGLGTASLFLWSSFDRWNRIQAVKRGYDSAPASLALACFAGYVATTTLLLAVLEAWPQVDRFAPLAFPLLTAVGGLCWSLYDQHRDRLSYHGMAWNWVATASEKPKEHKAQDSEPELLDAIPPQDSEPELLDAIPLQVDSLLCDRCSRVFAWPGDYGDRRAAQNALNAHSRAHGNGRAHE